MFWQHIFSSSAFDAADCTYIGIQGNIIKGALSYEIAPVCILVLIGNIKGLFLILITIDKIFE